MPSRGGAGRGEAAARPFSLAAVVVLSLLALALAPQLVRADHGPGSNSWPAFGGTPPDSSEPSDGTIADARERRAARRNSPAAKQARKRSRRAHANLSSKQARKLARRKFRAIFAIPRSPLDLSRGQRVERYPTDSSALIEDEDGDPSLLVSRLPLRVAGEDGEIGPPDLRLVDRGGAFEPARPLARVTITESNGAFAFKDVGVRVRPVLSEAAGAPTAVRGHVFLANAATDADLLIKAMPRGLETFSIVRSEDAPEAQRYRFSLPAGARLVLRGIPAGQGAAPAGVRQFVEVVDRDERPLMSVAPPIAADSDGEPVPVSYQVSGKTLTIRIDHRGGDYAYPIQVDPLWDVQERFMTWLDNGPAIDSVGWRYQVHQPNPNAPCRWAGVFDGPWWHNYRWGLYSWSDGNQWCDDNGWGEWVWIAPRNSRIHRADLGYIRHWWKYSCIELGIWNVRQWRWDAPWETAPYPWQNCSGPPNELAYSWVTLCPSRDCAAPASQGNAAVFKLRLLGTGWRDATAIGYLGAAALYLQDDEDPWIDALDESPPAPTGWVKSGVYSQSPTAHDDGLGMMRYDWIVPGQPTEIRVHPCQGSARCPHYWRNPDPNLADRGFNRPFTYDVGRMPEGRQRVTLRAYDALDKTADANRDIHVDRTGPQITDISGELYERRNRSDDHRREGLYDESYALSVTAVDGSNNSDAERRSGVKRIDIEVVNQETGQVEHSDPDPAPQGCPPHSCDKTRPWVFRPDDYSDGQHIVRIRAVDQIDNVSATSEFRVTVDRRGDIYTADVYEGGNPTTGELTSTEWTRAGTTEARSVEADQVATRAPVDCPANSRVGAACDEVRARLLATEDGGFADDDDFSVRIAERTDERLEPVSDIADRRVDPAQLSGAGPIVDALEPWQHAPPAGGIDYELYESREVVRDETGVEREIVTRLWVDGLRKFPLRITSHVTGSSESSVTYYDYGVGRFESSQVPADLFRVPRPSDPASEETEHVGWTGFLLPTVDRETGASFQPRNIGPSNTIDGRDYCLAADSRFTEDVDEPPYLPMAGEDPETVGDPAGPITAINSDYNAVPEGASCDPGNGSLVAPALSISSYARNSTVGAAWITAYQEAIAEFLSDPAFDDSSRAGTMPVMIGLLEPAIAYIVPYSDTELAVLAATSTTVYTVKGAFEVDDVPLIFASMEAVR